jgi:hypothetical protein
MCGLQASVIRACVFANLRLPSYLIGEDQMLAIAALKAGNRFAYLDAVHVLYRVHEDNLTSSADSATQQKKRWIMDEETRCFEGLLRDSQLSMAERRAVRWRLAQQFFWQIGYAQLWENGHRQDAVAMFRRGLRYWPWSLRCWKTYCLAQVRTLLSPRRNCTPRPVIQEKVLS